MGRVHSKLASSRIYATIPRLRLAAVEKIILIGFTNKVHGGICRIAKTGGAARCGGVPGRGKPG